MEWGIFFNQILKIFSETADSLVEESGCRIESTLCSRLREYVIHGIWNKALGIIEKLKSSISDKQYLTARVLLLEEKFHILIANEEVKFKKKSL